MVYYWFINYNGKEYTIKAVRGSTAVYRVIGDKDTSGRVSFRRGGIVGRSRCAVCGRTYPSAEHLDHLKTWRHEEAVKRQQAEAEKKSTTESQAGVENYESRS